MEFFEEILEVNYAGLFYFHEDTLTIGLADKLTHASVPFEITIHRMCYCYLMLIIYPAVVVLLSTAIVAKQIGLLWRKSYVSLSHVVGLDVSSQARSMKF